MRRTSRRVERDWERTARTAGRLARLWRCRIAASHRRGRGGSRRVETFDAVRRHHDDPAFGGGDAVDRVEQAGEGQAAFLAAGALAADEGAIDVLQKQEAAFGDGGEQV